MGRGKTRAPLCSCGGTHSAKGRRHCHNKRSGNPCREASNNHDPYRLRRHKRPCADRIRRKSGSARWQSHRIESYGSRFGRETAFVPTASRVGMLWNASDEGMALRVRETRLAAPTIQVTLLSPEVRTPADLESAFDAFTQDPPDVLLVFVDPFTVTHRQRIVDFAAAKRLPAIYEDRVFVDAGGLMSYGPDVRDNCRRAATYVDKILRGAKPSDLPVEQPTKFELVMNLKTARALGLDVPPTLLARADEVIE